MEKILTRATLNPIDSESRTIEGCAIVFNRWSNDLGGFIERILPEAITQELIDNSDVIANCEHNSQDYMLARCRKGEGTLKLELREDGVYFSFDAPDTEKGNDILYHVRNGNIFECSFAFTLPENRSGEKWYKEDGQIKRDIMKIACLYDVSLVGRGAYSDTFCYNRSIPEDVLNEFKDEVIVEEIVENTEEVRELPVENKIENINNKNIKKSMEKRFSLVGAINAIANNKNVDETVQAVDLNGKEEMRKAGLAYGGQIQLPVNELRAVVSVGNEGDDVVATDLYDIMSPLRAKNVLVQAGAKFLTGLVGDVQIPIMTAGNVGWEGEIDAAKDGAGSFSHKTLKPHRLTCYVDISKQMLNQDSVGVENMIRQDIINAINSKLEATILGDGDGKAGGSTVVAPKGMFNGKTTVKSVTTMAKIADVEATVESANVIGECKYIVSPTFKATLRDKAKGSNVSESLYKSGEIDGTPALSTSHVAANQFVYGDFSNLAIGQWGAIDLTVDTYTQAVNGKVRLVVNAYFDAQVLRDEAFVFGTTAAS